MKKIINGKKYDTKTATKLGEFWNGLSASDFNNFTESLYRKESGEYFLHGEGGGNTIYCSYVEGTARTGGQKIIPYTEDEAREWAEENLDADEYEEIFGEVAE